MYYVLSLVWLLELIHPQLNPRPPPYPNPNPKSFVLCKVKARSLQAKLLPYTPLRPGNPLVLPHTLYSIHTYTYVQVLASVYPVLELVLPRLGLVRQR